MPDQTSITFRIIDITLVENEIHLPSSSLPVDETKVNFHTVVKHEINIDNKHVFVTLEIRTVYGKEEELIGRFVSRVAFYVDNFNELIRKKESGIIMHDNLINTLNSITISTSRGMMFMAFRGTHLHKVFLPLADLSQFAPLPE